MARFDGVATHSPAIPPKEESVPEYVVDKSASAPEHHTYQVVARHGDMLWLIPPGDTDPMTYQAADFEPYVEPPADRTPSEYVSSGIGKALFDGVQLNSTVFTRLRHGLCSRSVAVQVTDNGRQSLVVVDVIDADTIAVRLKVGRITDARVVVIG